ncbi:MAG TPA: phytoene/squalene synthase family protein [Stellaceae bacterium]|nr:phytoene/squalene synthase family protein [Stellaceae bacterium]
MDAALTPIARLVRRHDRDRFLTALFASGECRDDLFALYAFNHEVAKTREVVSEAALGRVRLQWWRECVAGIYAGEVLRRHEVMEPLAIAVRRHVLPRESFDRLIDARESDLENGPPDSLAALERYLDATSGSLVSLALAALGSTGEEAAAAAHAVGIAYGLTGLLRAIPIHARAKRLYLPHDLSAAAGLSPERDLFELRSSPELRRVVAQLADFATAHLAVAETTAAHLRQSAIPALLPAVLARADLARLKRARYDPFARLVRRHDPWRGWRLTWAAWRRRHRRNSI